MQWIRDAHTWCSIQSTYFSMSSFKGKANGSQSWRCLSSEGGLLLESKSKGEIKDDLTKYRKDDSDIYNGLTSSINATDASCLKNTCFDEAGKFEACLKIECLAEGWEFVLNWLGRVSAIALSSSRFSCGAAYIRTYLKTLYPTHLWSQGIQ